MKENLTRETIAKAFSFINAISDEEVKYIIHSAKSLVQAELSLLMIRRADRMLQPIFDNVSPATLENIYRDYVIHFDMQLNNACAHQGDKRFIAHYAYTHYWSVYQNTHQPIRYGRFPLFPLYLFEGNRYSIGNRSKKSPSVANPVDAVEEERSTASRVSGRDISEDSISIVEMVERLPLPSTGKAVGLAYGKAPPSVH